MALSSVGKAVSFISRACTTKVVIEAFSWSCARTLFALIYTQFRPLEPSFELKQVRGDTRAIDVGPMALSSVGKAVAFISRACTAKVVIEALSWPCARTLFALIDTQYRP